MSSCGGSNGRRLDARLSSAITGHDVQAAMSSWLLMDYCCFARFGSQFATLTMRVKRHQAQAGAVPRVGDSNTTSHSALPSRLRQTMATKLRAAMSAKLRAAIVVVSETASRDSSTDKCIPALRDVFQQDGGDRWEAPVSKIVSDDVLSIQKAITGYSDGPNATNLVVTSGGTGFAQKDVTPEVCPPCK